MAYIHVRLIKKGQSLGYQLADAGVCHGFNMRWMEACLTNQQHQFNQLIDIIMDSHSLKSDIEQVRLKVKQNAKRGPEEQIPLTTREQLLLEVPAFYDGLALYQEPDQYTMLFGQPTAQAEIEKVSLFASSKLIEGMDGLTSTLIQADIYTEAQLASYLEQLASIINENNEQYPDNHKVVIGLRSMGHATSLIYDVTNQSWTFMDVNQWPPITQPATDLATKIIKSISFDPKKPSTLSFYLISSKHQAEKDYASHLATALKLSLHEAPPLVSKNISDKNWDELLKTALRFDSEEIFKRLWLSDEKRILMSRGGGQPSVADLAAFQGCSNIIREFFVNQEKRTCKVDMNTKDEFGWSPVHSASRYVTVIDVLKMIDGVDWNIKDNYGWAPVHLAVGGSSLKVIDALKTIEGIDWNIPNNHGSTPAHIAARMGNVDVIKALNDINGFRWNAPNNLGDTPVSLAAQEGHKDVIDLLASFDPTIDKPFALFIMEVNQFMIKQKVSDFKLKEINMTLNKILKEPGTKEEKADKFFHSPSLEASLKTHQGFFRKLAQKIFKVTVGDTHSITQFHQFKHEYLASKAAEKAKSTEAPGSVQNTSI